MLPIPHCELYHPHAGLAVEGVATGHENTTALRRSLSAVTNRFNRKRQRFSAIERELLTSREPPVVLCLSEYVKATVRKHYPALPRRSSPRSSMQLT